MEISSGAINISQRGRPAVSDSPTSNQGNAPGQSSPRTGLRRSEWAAATAMAISTELLGK
jgi:hypothetical protein